MANQNFRVFFFLVIIKMIMLTAKEKVEISRKDLFYKWKILLRMKLRLHFNVTPR